MKKYLLKLIKIPALGTLAIAALVLFLCFIADCAFGQVPTIWQSANGVPCPMSAYCVNMERDSIGNKRFYLLGFNPDGKQNLKLRVENITYDPSWTRVKMFYPNDTNYIELLNPLK